MRNVFWLKIVLLLGCGLVVSTFWWVTPVEAANVRAYSDTISDSRPGATANHTFSFTVTEPVAPSGVVTLQFPADFYVGTSSGLLPRNVEMVVNGSPRAATTSPSATNDGVTIVAGYGGSVTYTLDSSTGLAAEDDVVMKLGNHTTNSVLSKTVFSTSTGTTTVTVDRPSIQNSTTTGTHGIPMTITGGAEAIGAEFQIAVIPGIGVGPADTTEDIPPFRFNGAPTGTLSGTSLAVEISLETNEFAECRWSPTPGVSFNAMGNSFDDTGLVVHSTVVSVTIGALNQFYVRCIDDEDNFNIDDYIVEFTVNDTPTGIPNADGDVEGDGTGDGNDGTGDGDGGGGETGESDGDTDTIGGSTGGGGSGGGGGGGTGASGTNQAGGGFESNTDLYPSGDAEVIINGYAFPGSTVYALVDGTVAETTNANSSGRYSVTIEEIARGAYTFGVYAIDENDIRSSTFSTSFTVTGGRTSNLSNINVMPSILVEPDPVTPGETLTLSGYAIPRATVTIENERDGVSLSRQEFTTTSDEEGFWQTTIDTSSFTRDTYKVRAQAVALDSSVQTNFSDYTFYGVGQEADVPLNADLNRDGFVNLTDFSILLFWWGSDGGTSDPPADINRDGDVSLTDFSILLFNWTG